MYNESCVEYTWITQAREDRVSSVNCEEVIQDWILSSEHHCDLCISREVQDTSFQGDCERCCVGYIFRRVGVRKCTTSTTGHSVQCQQDCERTRLWVDISRTVKVVSRPAKYPLAYWVYCMYLVAVIVIVGSVNWLITEYIDWLSLSGLLFLCSHCHTRPYKAQLLWKQGPLD